MKMRGAAIVAFEIYEAFVYVYGAAPAEARYQISGVGSALGVQFRSC